MKTGDKLLVMPNRVSLVNIPSSSIGLLLFYYPTYNLLDGSESGSDLV